jgi:hypothetical protein
VESVLDEDGKGGYRFDHMAFKDPIDILGFFLGYMSGPVAPESPEEHDERIARIIILPEEPASTTASVL